MTGGNRDELCTIFADEVEFEDAGDTIRCLLYVREPGGRRTLRISLVMPRGGFLSGLFGAIDQFVDRETGGGLTTLTLASDLLH